MVKKITKKLVKSTNVRTGKNIKTITVKNADGEPDTTATILVQNKISYTPKVSVIIPVYNVEKYLRECLDSVVNQTLREIEIICVDDGSTDSSLDILKEYASKDNRITIITQNNSGSGIARNCGLNVAKGEFVAFMDPDDFYPSENTLSNVYSAAIANNVKICGGSFVVLENGVIDTNIIRFGKGYIFEKNQKMKYSDYQFDCGYWRFIFNREFLAKNNLYFPDYLRGQDVPFFIHAMALAGEFYALQEPTYVYRTSYKKINFTERRFMDYTKSLLHCLKLAVKFDLCNLQDTIINARIDNQFYTNLCTQFSNIPDCKKLSDTLIEFRDNVRDSQNISTTNKKKIFLISHPGVLTSVGGATKIFFDMGRTLNDADYEVTLLCWADLDKKANEFYADYNVHFLNLHCFYHNLDFEQAINRYIKSKKPDLMIFFFPDVFLKASLSEENNKIPKILMFHSRPDWYFHNWTNTQIEQIISLYKNTYTQVLLPSYINLLPDFIDKSTVRAIANPVQQSIKRNNYNEQKKIIFLTRHDQCKGLEFLLMSYKNIANKYPSWKLDIYGQFFSPEYEKTIRGMISDLKLTKNVFLKGVTKDVLNTLCNYDFCVFPSYFEGFSVGLAEALSVGLPCVGLKGASGVNEQIIDGVNGFLCDNKYSDFAEKIETLIKDKKQRETFSKNAIASIDQYAQDKIYDNWLKYINEILSGKPSKTRKSLKAANISNANTLFPISSIKKAYIHNTNAVREYKNTHQIPSGPRELIVSLTSYPARIGTVNQTIETLLNQSLCPDKVILWLAPEQFPNREADLPQQLLDLRNKGLVIDWYHDIRSYKKLIPTLKKYPDALIVTADDDILYKPDWLHKLYNAYQDNPEVIWCHRSHKIQNDLYNYTSWWHCISTNAPAATNFCTTGGGVLYPPYCFHQDVLNEQKFMSLCPDADDIWFWSMLVLKGKKVCTVPSNHTTINLIDGTQEDALWIYNGQGGGNNKCLASMYDKYPALLRIIKMDIKQQNAHKNKNNRIKPYLLFPYYLCNYLYGKHIKLPLTSLRKHGIAGLRKLKAKKIKNLPQIQANAFISLGWNCKPAYQLKQNNIRQTSLPFDWMYDYSLEFVLETLRSNQLNWFYDFTEGQPISQTKRRIKDNHSQMISLHHFPMNYSVTEYLPIFNSIFTRRKNRFDKMLSEYDDVCFVMNRTDDILDILKFMKNISAMYPKTHFTIVNIRQDDSNKDIYKYKLNKKCILYDIHFNDVHDTDTNTKTNPNAWIGSNSFWKKLTEKFSISQNTNSINIDNDFDIYMKEVAAYTDKLQKQQNVLAKQINDISENQKKFVSECHSDLLQQIAKITSVVSDLSAELSQQIADFQSSTSQSNDALAKKIIDLNTVTENKSNDLSQQIADFKSATDISSEVLAQHITDLNSTTNTCSNSITKTINQTYDNVKNHIESIQLNVASNHDKLDKNMSNIVSIIEHNAADSKNDIKSVKQDIEKTNRQIDATKQYFENNQVLYFSRFETTTRKERGMCDMVSAPNFEERFKKLMAGLPAESAETVVKIIRRLQMIKDTTNKLDLFTEEEKTQLKKVRNLGKEILKISDNLYAYKNYMLPINHFEASVFVYNHGISQLNSVDTFKDKDILDIGGFIGDSVLMLAPLTTGKVHSFEATNENYNHMLKTIELNGIKNAVPVHTAVGDKPGEIELRFNGSASSQNEIMVKEPQYVEKSPVITIDDYVREHKLSVGLIKVDIEGAEQSFLRGAYETIRTQKPTLLISIYHNVDDFLDIKPMIESWNLGYKFKIFKPTLDSISGETLLICEQ